MHEFPPPEQEYDPSLPHFHYSESDKEAMKKKGMTDEDIQRKENEVNQKLAERQLEKEKKAA